MESVEYPTELQEVQELVNHFVVLKGGYDINYLLVIIALSDCLEFQEFEKREYILLVGLDVPFVEEVDDLPDIELRSERVSNKVFGEQPLVQEIEHSLDGLDLLGPKGVQSVFEQRVLLYLCYALVAQVQLVVVVDLD